MGKKYNLQEGLASIEARRRHQQVTQIPTADVRDRRSAVIAKKRTFLEGKFKFKNSNFTLAEAPEITFMSSEGLTTSERRQHTEEEPPPALEVANPADSNARPRGTARANVVTPRDAIEGNFPGAEFFPGAKFPREVATTGKKEIEGTSGTANIVNNPPTHAETTQNMPSTRTDATRLREESRANVVTPPVQMWSHSRKAGSTTPAASGTLEPTKNRQRESPITSEAPGTVVDETDNSGKRHESARAKVVTPTETLEMSTETAPRDSDEEFRARIAQLAEKESQKKRTTGFSADFEAELAYFERQTPSTTRKRKSMEDMLDDIDDIEGNTDSSSCRGGVTLYAADESDAEPAGKRKKRSDNDANTPDERSEDDDQDSEEDDDEGNESDVRDEGERDKAALVQTEPVAVRPDTPPRGAKGNAGDARTPVESATESSASDEDQDNDDDEDEEHLNDSHFFDDNEGEPSSSPDAKRRRVQSPEWTNDDSSAASADGTQTPEQTDPEYIIWDEYVKLAQLPPPPNRIPPQHVKDFIAAADKCAKTFLQSPTPRHLFDIVRLPKTVFDPFLTRRKTNVIRTALRDYPKVETADPKAPKRKQWRPRLTRTGETRRDRVKRAERLFKEGYMSKALKAVSSTLKPVNITEEVEQKIRALHPSQDLFSEEDDEYDDTPILPDNEDIMKTVKKINIEASGGPSGWNPRHLKVAMRSKAFVDFMTRYAGMMATNTAPGRMMMTMMTSIALKDEQTGKIRPIDMGEVIYKVCAITSMKKNRQNGDLNFYQLGCGTPNGTEPLIYLEKQHFMGDEWEGEELYSVDRPNAYNTKKLKDVRRGLKKRNPRNGPLFEWTYGRPTHIIFRTANGEYKTAVTTCLRQGDPLSMYFFEAGDCDNIEALQEAVGDNGMVWSYVDDIRIFKSKQDEDSSDGDEEPTLMMVQRVLGQENINIQKSRQVTKETFEREGLETFGGFVGTQRQRSEFLRVQVDKVIESIDKIGDLRKQTQMVLMKQCIIPSINYCMRNVDPTGCEHQYRRLQQAITRRVSRLADAPVRLTGRLTRMGWSSMRGHRAKDTDIISLPGRYGGLGMGDQEVQARIAYDACQDKCKYLVDKWMQGTIRSRPPTSQRQRMDTHWRRVSNALLDRLRPQQRLRVAANSTQTAKSWISATPHKAGLTMTDDEVATGLRSRLLQSADRVNATKRKVLDQLILNEFKLADIDAKLVTTTTSHTTTDDPMGMSESVVEPMAISVSTLNVTCIEVPRPPQDTRTQGNLLNYYVKKIHDRARKIQRRKFRRYYEGYTHFPMVVSTTGAVLGATKKWVQDLKKRATLNKTPSAITQIIANNAVKSLC